MSRGKGRKQKAESRSAFARVRALVALILLLSAFCFLLSCRQKMANQPRYDPLEPSDFFADGMAARPRIAGTVARGEISGNAFLDTGKSGNTVGDGFPFPVTETVIN